MKTSKRIAATALSMLAIVGAHAETYEGVHPLATANSRAEVTAQAVRAARTADPYAEGYAASQVTTAVSAKDRASVRAEAVATAHAPNQNLKREAFVGSVVPLQYTTARPLTRQAGL